MARGTIERISFVAITLALAWLVGCGGTRLVNVNGTVLSGGQPIAVSSTGIVQVTLVPDVPAGQPYTTHVGRCNSAGKFAVENVPAGKYRIAVEHLDPTPQVDKLNGEFSAGQTKLVREIDGKSPLLIDLAQPGA